VTTVPTVHTELEGWELAWAGLELQGEPGEIAAAANHLERRQREVEAQSRQRFSLQAMTEDPAIAAMRSLFRQAGCDPTRYRPSSEALLRRVLKGDALPKIHPLVDLNNCLSIALAVPCCVLAEGSVRAPFVLRAGRDDEAFESLRGPFNLGGKPLLADSRGPFGSPITDSERVKVRPETHRAWLVAYLPRGIVEESTVQRELDALRQGVSGVGRFVIA
jgi:DNA/RNA-binding domain of Phe-tRNA-synthetase-like protein